MASRSQGLREARRAAQFSKFRLVHLNLVPLVDTLVSIVFFALVTQTAGDLAPISRGVNLPTSAQTVPALHELTLAVASSPAQISIGGEPVMSVQEAALARSDNPRSPLLIPQLYSRLRQAADSIRKADGTPADQSVSTTLAIQGDRTMRYDLLSRVLQTAREAGFKNLSLQVLRTEQAAGTAPARST